jgi:hypothetical protein
MKENLSETIQFQNLKRKDQFEEYGTCGTVGDVRMDLTEIWRLCGLASCDARIR